MWNYVILVVVLYVLHFKVEALWDSDVLCPMVCNCRLEHLKDTAIHRFMHKNHDNQIVSESDQYLHNDVLYEDELVNELLDENPILRTVTCILQTETEPIELIENLPKDTESLTIIQGTGSGKKSITVSQLAKFSQLIILELYGTNMNNDKTSSNFYYEIDTYMHGIKYLNLDKVLLKASKLQMGQVDKKIHEDVVTFEYTKQLNPSLHPLTMVNTNKKREILPYKKYVQQEENNEIPLFLGFNNLILLRISSCELNNMNWEMFDGLNHLNHLILEKNNLMFIPDFAFYGTPNLKSLSLAWNNLLNMQITDLAGLLELEYLDLSHNNFSQLSELSFPPFPKLKLANFGNNPISVIFPSTFDVMNTTHSLIIGGEGTPLTLITNSFSGLLMLKKLTLHNLVVPLLKRELIIGMPNLKELLMTGNVSKIEYDAFLDVSKLEKLLMTQCQLKNISTDAFIGLNKLEILDVSQNHLEYLQPGTFDPLTNIKELYLNNNKFRQLTRDIFLHVHAKLIRLNDNPWHCTCKMSDWKPMIVNKVKQKSTKNCDFTLDKGISCNRDSSYDTIFIFDTHVAPKCATPKKFKNWNVFHIMRKQLKCQDYKPKIKKRVYAQSPHKNDNNTQLISTYIQDNNTKNSTNNSNYYAMKLKKLQMKMTKHETNNYDLNLLQDVPVKISLFSPELSINNEDNGLNYLHGTNDLPTNSELNNTEINNNMKFNTIGHTKKYKKHKKQNKLQNQDTYTL